MAEEYMSFEDVLKELQVSEEELQSMVSDAQLRAYRDEDTMKFRRADVENLREQRQTEQTVILPGELGGGDDAFGDDDDDLLVIEEDATDGAFDVGDETDLVGSDTEADGLATVELDEEDETEIPTDDGVVFDEDADLTATQLEDETEAPTVADQAADTAAEGLDADLADFGSETVELAPEDEVTLAEIEGGETAAAQAAVPEAVIEEDIEEIEEDEGYTRQGRIAAMREAPKVGAWVGALLILTFVVLAATASVIYADVASSVNAPIQSPVAKNVYNIMAAVGLVTPMEDAGGAAPAAPRPAPPAPEPAPGPGPAAGPDAGGGPAFGGEDATGGEPAEEPDDGAIEEPGI